MVTVFTPTYNRAYILNDLYQSLCRQTCRKFEWLIVDDGSTDNTEGLVASWLDEGKMSLRYIKQPNGGNHRAINKGIQEANGDLFFIVDSDDYLAKNAIERILFFYGPIKDNHQFAGVSGVRAYPSGERIGGELSFDILEASTLELSMKYHISGDMAEVYKTDILRQYPFPEFAGEHFCPEALVWNRIAQRYKLYFFNEKIYVCDYLPDGLTAHIIQVRMKSPLASLLYYSELYHMNISLGLKIRTAINYWRFSFCTDIPFTDKIDKIGICALSFYLAGLLFHLKDVYQSNKNSL